MLIAKASSGGSFTPVSAGMHLARCYRLVDLGTQKSEYMGQVKMLHKVMIQFEVHGEDDQGNPMLTAKGEPLSISKNYTLSLGDKSSLRNDLKTWRGRDFTPEELKGFDLKNILGVWAMLSIIKSTGRDGKEYTNIQAVMPVPVNVKKAGLPKAHNEPMFYDLNDPDPAVFETFSDNLKAKIMASPEYQARTEGNYSTPSGAFSDDDSDPIPF